MADSTITTNGASASTKSYTSINKSRRTKSRGYTGDYINVGTSAIDPRNIKSGQIISLWENTKRRFTRSRERIIYCRSVQQGGEGWRRPDLDTDDDEFDPLTARMPARDNVILDVVNDLSSEIPRIVRRPIGDTQTARRGAELCSVWCNEGINDSFDYEEAYNKFAEDGEFGLIVQPDVSCVERAPSFLDLLDYQIEGYEPYELPSGIQKFVKVDSEGTRQPRQEYLRNSANEPIESTKAPDYSAKNTTKAYNRSRDAWLAENHPWVIRLISPTDCVPILTLGRKKKKFQTRGLIIRTLYEREELLEANYLWNEDKLLVPRGFDPNNNHGSEGMLYLYEAHLWINNRWIVVYSVAGRDTSFRLGSDEKADAVIDITTDYGIDKFLVDYFYGLHTGSDDPDMRGRPVLWPITQAIIGAESMMTAAQVHASKSSFNGYFVTIDPKAPQSSYLESDGTLRVLEMPESGQVLLSPGPAVPAVPSEIGKTATYVLEKQLATIQTGTREQESAPYQSYAGISKTEELNKTANRQILTGMLSVAEFLGSSLLIIGCALKRKFGIEVPVSTNKELEPGADNPKEPSKSWRILSLKESWISDVYKVSAEFPEKSDPVKVQQVSDLQTKGLASREDVMLARGKEQPLAELAKIDAERILVGTPEGQIALLANALRWRGEIEKAEALEAQLAGKLSQFGMPIAAMDGDIEEPGTAPNMMGAGPEQGSIGGNPDQGVPIQQPPPVAESLAPQSSGAGKPTPTVPASMLGGMISGGRMTRTVQGAPQINPPAIGQ